MCICTSNPPHTRASLESLAIKALLASEVATSDSSKQLSQEPSLLNEAESEQGRCSCCGHPASSETKTCHVEAHSGPRRSCIKAPAGENYSSDVNGKNSEKKRVHFGTSSDNYNGDSTSSLLDSPVKVEILGPLLVPSSEMSASEKRIYWWQNADYEIFKGTARMISNEIRRRDAVAMNEAAATGQTSGGIYGHVLTRAFAACCIASERHSKSVPHGPSLGKEGEVLRSPLSRMDEAQLVHWVRVGHSRRGLERWSACAMARERQMRKDRALAGVLEVQRTGTMGADEIRIASENFTRPSRLFALALGQADAAAAYYFYSGDGERTLTSEDYRVEKSRPSSVAPAQHRSVRPTVPSKHQRVGSGLVAMVPGGRPSQTVNPWASSVVVRNIRG